MQGILLNLYLPFVAHSEEESKLKIHMQNVVQAFQVSSIMFCFAAHSWLVTLSCHLLTMQTPLSCLLPTCMFIKLCIFSQGSEKDLSIYAKVAEQLSNTVIFMINKPTPVNVQTNFQQLLTDPFLFKKSHQINHNEFQGLRKLSNLSGCFVNVIPDVYLSARISGKHVKQCAQYKLSASMIKKVVSLFIPIQQESVVLLYSRKVEPSSTWL